MFAEIVLLIVQKIQIRNIAFQKYFLEDREL